MIRMGTIDIGKYPDVVNEIFGDVIGTPSIKDTIKDGFLEKLSKCDTIFRLFYIVIRLLYQIELMAVFSAAFKITMVQ